MPNKFTFQMKPVAGLLGRHVLPGYTVVDPFCGSSRLGQHRNDLAESGVDANQYMDSLIEARGEGWADVCLLDPPYSPRQISEHYKSAGLPVGAKETQNARLYSGAIERMDRVLKIGGKAIRCGWNSCGFGVTRGYVLNEVLLVCHGAAHNDTIVTVETKSRAL